MTHLSAATAHALKAAGFPQPALADGQIWFYEDIYFTVENVSLHNIESLEFAENEKAQWLAENKRASTTHIHQTPSP